MPYRIWAATPFMTALLLAASAPAADWLQWGGTNQRNMVSSEAHLPESVSPGRLVEGPQRLDHAGRRSGCCSFSLAELDLSRGSSWRLRWFGRHCGIIGRSR